MWADLRDSGLMVEVEGDFPLDQAVIDGKAERNYIKNLPANATVIEQSCPKVQK